jgi:hypothetical protein
MLRRKSKMQFVKQERNTQNAFVLLNYLNALCRNNYCKERKFSQKILKHKECNRNFIK